MSSVPLATVEPSSSSVNHGPSKSLASATRQHRKSWDSISSIEEQSRILAKATSEKRKRPLDSISSDGSIQEKLELLEILYKNIHY